MIADSELVKQAVDGDTDAFRTLVERYQDAVFGVALSKTGSYCDAEDIAQEVLLAAFGSLARLKDPGSFGSWLYGIALNKSRAHLRARQNRKRAHDCLIEKAAHETPADKADDSQAAVSDVLAGLPECNREAATLFYINGYSVADISRFTDRPVGTIKRRLHDARARLRKELLIMMASELKRTRPGKRLTDSVLRKITRTRVWLGKGQRNILLFSDSQGHCYQMPLRRREARAIAAGAGGPGGGDKSEGIDLNVSVLELLSQCGWQVGEVTLTASTEPDVLVRLTVATARGGPRIVEATFGVQHALHFAAAAKGDLFLDHELAEGWKVRRKDGKPMSPAAAWREITAHGGHSFRNIEQVFQALERDPDDKLARKAMGEARDQHTTDTPHIEDTTGASAKLIEWARQRKGTKYEGLAAGLAGAVYLAYWPDPIKLPKALAYLKRAHQLQPADERIAFDLATAHAFAGQTESALALLEKFKFESAPKCANFKALWDHPRFAVVAGRPQRRYEHCHRVEQIDEVGFHAPPATTTKSKRFEFRKPIAKCPATLRKALPPRVDGHALLSITHLLAPLGKEGGDEQVLLELHDKTPAAVPLPEWFDSGHLDLLTALQDMDYPWCARGESVAELLAALEIEVDALVLQERPDDSVVACLCAHRGRRHTQVAVDAIDGLALALRVGRPLLLTEPLAEKLSVRGKSGRPLTIAGATRKLRK